MDDWPSSLPLPMLSSQLETSPRGGLTEMESGRVRRRRLFIDPFLVTDVQWTLKVDQFATFKLFFDETLSNGSKTFVIAIYGEVKEVAFVEARYSSSHTDGIVSVSGSLQIITNLDTFLALSGESNQPILLAGDAGDILLSG